METYTKINENDVEITVTTENVTTVSLSELKFQIDSLMRNKEENLREAMTRNEQIDDMIAELSDRKAKFESLGIVDMPPMKIESAEVTK